MKKFKAKNLGEILGDEHKTLGFVLDKAKRLEKLNELIIPLLEEHIQPYCRVANIQNQHVTLLCANGSIATQLRFKTSLLLSLFKHRPQLAGIKSVTCKVNPSLNYPRDPRFTKEDPQNQVERLSHQTADIINRIAEELTSPELKAIMLRIAKRTL